MAKGVAEKWVPTGRAGPLLLPGGRHDRMAAQMRARWAAWGWGPALASQISAIFCLLGVERSLQKFFCPLERASQNSVTSVAPSGTEVGQLCCSSAFREKVQFCDVRLLSSCFFVFLDAVGWGLPIIVTSA
ncbi:unnamed protein product [Ostreobium quekettii]|uniref:Uncharacterized protein n=1 Tax=Ostreobium quekettii TaxID=121088 RepID=A0A8S1JCI1_9CHLO|nr:unnamed protein product [Ostreobium quekettii]